MGRAANSLVGKVVQQLLGGAKKEITYIWNYTGNVENFRNEVEKLKHMRGRIRQLITIAEENGEDLVDGVQEWIDKVDAHISMAEKFLEEETNANKSCFNIQLCLNLGTLHHYSKKAKSSVPSLLEHQEDGKPFQIHASLPSRTSGFLEVYQKKDLDGLNTHKLALEEITKAIIDESVQIIGVYGMGGVGKTTLSKEVAATVKNQFAAILFITVSQTVDAARIEKDVEAAAKRIMKGDKVLIILDDVWGELKLDEVAIPCGIEHMNCKILVTSRSKDVCVVMNAQIVICVGSLLPEESWLLFKHVVGEMVETDAKLNKVAKKVAEECGGLPLIVQAVGKALKNKSILSWETALEQLQKPSPSDIAPDIRKAFIHLKLSYDLLQSEEAKSCFLLCSMFPEDTSIPLERLAFYVVGREMFNDIDSMEDARNRVRLAVNTLESSCLLLENHNDEPTTKMHDVVRDVALLIASKDKHKHLVKAGKDLTEWQPRNKILESYTGISLMNNNIYKLPDYKLHLPLLDIFLMQSNSNLSTIPDEFALSMKEARVIDVEENNILSLPQSLKQLTRLRMLNLAGNRSLYEISILGELCDLEILILNHTGIKEIPQKFGQLVNLRHLEAKHCHDLSYIAPGVISSLRWLEELHLGLYSNEMGNYKCLEEIRKLSKLTFIDLFMSDVFYIPEKTRLGRLKGFIVQIGGHERLLVFTGDQRSKGTLVLGTYYPLMEHLKQFEELVTVSHDIVLIMIPHLRNVLPIAPNKGFNELKRLEVFHCFNFLCLVDSEEQDQIKTKFFSELEHLVLKELYNLRILWNCFDEYISLHSLLTLEIVGCPKLERLFTVTGARGLVNLQRLKIEDCHCLEEVIWDGDEGTSKGEIDMVTDIVFPCLVEISLCRLHNLRRFYSRSSIIKYPSLVKVNICHCYRMEKWSYGTHDTVRLMDLLSSTIDEGLGR